MKKYTFLACLFAFSPAAQALEVTNLDTMDHRVLFEVAGSQQAYEVPVNRTVYIPGQPNGFVSLITAEHPKPSEGVIHSDGILAGVIGNERTNGIPVETNDALVIWKGGHINIQQRRRGGRFH